MIFMRYVYIHLGHIWYKFGWNHSLNSKVMNLNLTMCQCVQITSQIILLSFQNGVVNGLSIRSIYKL